MLEDPQGEHKPSFLEIVAGKDASLGKEIVQRLKNEGVGLTVKSLSFETKHEIAIDRAPGENSFNVREKTRKEKELQRARRAESRSDLKGKLF